MSTTHTCILGDSRTMDDVADSSVHLVVTSPPYWQLKDYGAAEQIGYNHSYEEYINHLNLVWSECCRALHPGCRMVINIGDQFARAAYYGRYKVIPIRTEIIKYCESIGMDYMGAIIWQKKTTMNTSGGATVMGSYPYPRNGIIVMDYEFILIFKKPGDPPQVSKDIKELSALAKEQWQQYFRGHWTFGGARQDKHLAMFPVELPKRTIEMFTFVGETVLDPFLGSGTTSLAAMQTGRNSIGYEINKDFLPVIREKLNCKNNSPVTSNQVNVKEQKPFNIDWQQKIDAQKYIFRDSLVLDDKAGSRKRKYGSKINQQDTENGVKRETLYIVKEIIAPDLIKLNNGEIVRLLGVKTVIETQDQAMEFLLKKILNRPVFLRYDETKHDEQNNTLAYLYMKNKTFINAHLIKRALCDVETGYAYKNKNKFCGLQQKANNESGLEN